MDGSQKRREVDISADNGIYILKTKGPEWRVAHLQAIDNIYWWPTCCENPCIIDDSCQEYDNPLDSYYHEKYIICGTRDPEWEKREEINPDMIMNYFGNCKVFNTEEEAFNEADRIYTEIMNDDCPIIEYGIQKINGLENEPFPTKEI